MKLLLFVLVVLAMTLVSTPATLVDRMVFEATAGGVRVGKASGSIWNGRGVVGVLAVSTREWRPWYGVEWTFDPVGLFRGRLSWRIIGGDTGASELAIGVSGWRVIDLRLAGPARNFLQRIPGAFSGFGWEGDISLDIGRFECSWRNICSGRVGANWVAAGSDFLPGQVFGDYRINAEAVAGRFSFDWASGDTSFIRTSGRGEVTEERALRLNGIVKGSPELLSRLPAIAGPWVRPTEAADTWRIVFP